MAENIESNPAEIFGFEKLAVQINENLRVRAPGDKTMHYSRVNDTLENAIVVTWPTSRGIRMPLRPKDLLEFSFVREGVPYGFTGHVQKINPDPLPQLTVTLNSGIKKTELRRYFRVKCFMPVEILADISRNGTETGERQSQRLHIRTTTYDLSAGGLAIRHTTRIPEESIIEVKLALPDGGREIRTPGRIAYVEWVSQSRSLYHMGIDCFAATEWERSRIIRCLYRIQLKSLRHII